MPLFYLVFRGHTAAEREAFLGLIVLEGAVLLVTGATFRKMGSELALLRKQVRSLEQPPVHAPMASSVEFLERFTHQCNLSSRYGNSFSVLFLGLDRFCELTEKQGSSGPREAEIQLGQMLCENLRNIDLAAQWGEGRLIALLPETGTEGAWTIAERIRSLLEQTAGRWGHEQLPLTASFGIVSYPESGCLNEDLLNLAEQALLKARTAGGNRIASA